MTVVVPGRSYGHQAEGDFGNRYDSVPVAAVPDYLGKEVRHEMLDSLELLPRGAHVSRDSINHECVDGPSGQSL